MLSPSIPMVPTEPLEILAPVTHCVTYTAPTSIMASFCTRITILDFAKKSILLLGLKTTQIEKFDRTCKIRGVFARNVNTFDKQFCQLFNDLSIVTRETLVKTDSHEAST